MMNKALIIGNGESRSWYNPSKCTIGDKSVITWGCNAIYRDGPVDNIVAMDYAMQQEIYDSGYTKNCCSWFANWNPVPSSVADVLLMGNQTPKEFIHRSKKRTDLAVISGKDPFTNRLHRNQSALSVLDHRVKEIKKDFPHLDEKDLKEKVHKDIGVWITYVNEDDIINSISGHEGWSAGCTAMDLACELTTCGEIYILGFDLSSYDEPLNNIYKGTDNYLSSDAKGFNTSNWLNQMQFVFEKHSSTQFYWVSTPLSKDRYSLSKAFVLGLENKNVGYLTKTEFCDKLTIT